MTEQTQQDGAGAAPRQLSKATLSSRALVKANRLVQRMNEAQENHEANIQRIKDKFFEAQEKRENELVEARKEYEELTGSKCPI